MEDKYQFALDKQRMIRRLGYNYVEIWHCQLKELLKSSQEMRTFFEQQKGIIVHLDPRDGLSGGRTGPTRLRYKLKEGEELRYVDVVRYRN